MTDPRPLFRVLVFLCFIMGLTAALAIRVGLLAPANPVQSGYPTAPTGSNFFSLARETPSPSQTVQPTRVPPTPTATATPFPQPARVRDALPPQVSAVAAVVVDDLSGAILHSKNAHLDRSPASITKIVTAVVALERGKLDDIVKVRYDPSELVDSTVMGVEPGDEVSLLDLLYGLMLPSGNDAALAIANHISGAVPAFAALMNARMADLNLRDSHFVNPHGLDARGHYTSAYDMAMVTRYAMRDSTFRDLSAARLHAVSVRTPKGLKSYDVFNLNRLLNSYRGADGVKVGYTENALRTIVGSATRDGHRVYAAVLGSTDLWGDAPALLDYAFKNFAWPDSPPQNP